MEPFDTSVKQIGAPIGTTCEGYTPDSPQPTPLGSRIRQERQRLGLSQAALAERVGVHRKTQVNYELGQRKPDTDYLQALAREGVDVGYVLTGEGRHEVEQIYSMVLDAIQVELDLYKAFQPEWESVFELLREQWRAWQGGVLLSSGADALRALLARSPKLLGQPEELAELIERVDFVAESVGTSPTPLQKARAVVLLLKEKRRGGLLSVDFGMVKEALARSG